MAANAAPITGHVLIMGKSLEGLGEDATCPDGKVYVVLSMRVEDARRVPMFRDVTLALKEGE